MIMKNIVESITVLIVLLLWVQILCAYDPCGTKVPLPQEQITGSPQENSSQPKPDTSPPQPVCYIKVTGKGSIINFMDKSSGKRLDHFALDNHQVQKMFTSPEGKWSIAIVKTRGKKQYYALPFHLIICEEMQTVSIPMIPRKASFSKDGSVTLFFPDGKEQQFLIRGLCP